MRDVGAELAAIVSPDRVLTRPIDRAAYAGDASCYRLVPAAVVRPRDVPEVQSILAWSRRTRVPLTFRAAGTSLSGQAVTEGVLVDVSRDWPGIEVLDDGRRVRVQPGAIGGHVNARLARHGTKIGPDPASIQACMIGGILANNSSGMCCGTERNAYRTVESLTFVLPSGLAVDSASEDAEAALASRDPALAEGLLDLRRRIVADRALAGRIRSKYRMKNTNGYSLNAFVDFETPLEILRHLMIGSEGTLGFMAEAVFVTVPDPPEKLTGLLYFADVRSACAAIAPLRDSGPAALELMDRPSLRAVAGEPGVPREVAGLPPNAAALLVEYEAPDPDALAESERRASRAVAPLPLLGAPRLTRDPGEREALWRLRKGLITSVGAARPVATTVLLEDVTFPVESLAPAVLDLQALFCRHGYQDAIVFGHAKDGNLHFLLTPSFGDAASVARFGAFLGDLATLVVDRYDGALKAEHGTGRNMAPFVEREWGSAAYGIMRDLKRLVDPDGVLNPGVILNDDPLIHVRNLKSMPEVEPEIDACIECGFCESRCPSRDLTLTPRQRIAVRRELARREREGASRDEIAAIEADATYEVVDTCAADGLCATSCPVGIDTGLWIKRLRRERRSGVARVFAALAADRFAVLEGAARRVLTWGVRPRAFADLPGPATVPYGSASEPAAVYFPSCLARTLGPPRATAAFSGASALVSVARRAGLPLTVPADSRGVCCGMAFSSKGFDEAADLALSRTVRRLWDWSREGSLPIVVDTSPCAWTLRTCGERLPGPLRRRWQKLTILDGIEFARDLVLPRLPVSRAVATAAVHPVCSASKLGLAGSLCEIVGRCAERVVVSDPPGCCGFAGDLGFRVPELTASATADLARAVEAAGPDICVSTSRTCEIGLARATGRPWLSLWNLLDTASRGEETCGAGPGAP